MFSEERLARASTQVAVRLTTTPIRATTRTGPPCTSGGSTRRRTPSTTTSRPRTSSVAPLNCAERISARRSPKVKAPRAGRWARPTAMSARPIAAASVSMCAASESSASDEATMPTTTSTAMKPRISASAIRSLPRSASGSIAWLCPWPAWAASWGCACADATGPQVTLAGVPSASFLAHRELAFMNPMGEAATDAAIAAIALPAGARVLETGCGSAELLLRVLEAHPDATGVGVDPDADGLEVAAREAARRVPGREPELIAATAQGAGLPAGAFDLVVNVAASHAHGGFPGALAELRELARPGGVVLLGEGYWTTTPSPAFLEALGGATEDELPLGADALAGAARAAGF